MKFLAYRQLEAVIRISESLAKMRLAPFATEADVDEAIRLFQVSTLDAATSGNLAGINSFFITIGGLLFQFLSMLYILFNLRSVLVFIMSFTSAEGACINLGNAF